MPIRRFTTPLATACAAFILPVVVHAQWLDYKTPGIPRTADGKPDLTAPAPKLPDGKPDLSGIWETNSGGYVLNVASDLKPGEVRPWAEALYQQRKENLSKDNPGLRCLPGIGPEISLGMYKILQTPGAIGFLSEGGGSRQILTDGRPLPPDPQPTWQGYSVGRWEGDTLVVQSAGFNDQTWLDFEGHPHSSELRVTERFRRKDFGHMELKTTFEDPKAYTRAWTISMNVDLRPDTELLEYVCNENERDVQHIVVTEEDRKKNRTKVTVAPEILAKYAGVYEMVDHNGRPIDRQGKVIEPGGKPETFTISVAEDHLVVELFGAGKIPLSTVSETTFTVAGQPVEFAKDAQGRVTHLVVRAVEGDFRAIRKGEQPAETAKQ
jgi:hypothetical protein